MKIFFSVGEPSGDLHAANLIHQLQSRASEVECLGLGGPKMAAAGCSLIEDMTQLAVMGLSRAVRHLPTFYRLLSRVDQQLKQQRPDAVVLVDYPGFNWHVARRAKRHGIPVFYYGVPQMWAWGSWRVRKMRRLIDHALCKLPFEADWYARRGCRATYVGHPYFDELHQRRLDETFIAQQSCSAQPLITILPGSRSQEVAHQLPWQLKAAGTIRQQVPEVRLAIASFNPRQALAARLAVERSGLPVDVHVGKTPELIQAAHSCLACSGSVSLELMFHAKPSVILYWARWLPFQIAWNLLITTRYVTLVNLLAVDEPFGRGRPYDPDADDAVPVPLPEYPTHQDKSQQMAGHIVRWLNDPTSYRRQAEWLQQLKHRFAHPGASREAARYILEALGHTPRIETRAA